MILFTLLLILLPIASEASIASDMENFFNAVGLHSNVTGAGAYQGQTAGLYTGGQIYARSRSRNIYPASIQLPSYSAGCGGIDAFTGSFSFISGNELAQSMQSIASSTGTYAFMIALETMSPQISGVQKHLSNIANAVNRANINSCETAASLVGGLWPKTEVAQHHICAAANAHSGFLSDWAAAKQGCKAGHTAETLASDRVKKRGWDDMVVQGKNIAWEAIKKSHYFDFVEGSQALDIQTKELLMSISGTLIFDKPHNDNAQNHYSIKPSLAEKQSFIAALLNGGEIESYRCDEVETCLTPTIVKYTIPYHKSFTGMVSDIMAGLIEKIKNDTPLSQKEIAFLGSTSFPIYKILNVDYAMGGGSDILNLNSYSQLIASDLLYRYISDNLALMEYAKGSLAYDEAYLKAYKEAIEKVRANINHFNQETKNNFNKTLTLIRQTQKLEQALAGQLSSHLVDVIGYENGG